jgi:hypothetical protein
MSEASRGRRAAHRADRMDAKEPGERMGSRPKPPEAGARSASLEPGRPPGYSQTSQLLPDTTVKNIPHRRRFPLPAARFGDATTVQRRRDLAE